MSADAVYAAALEACRAGLCVLPPKEDGSKEPLGKWKTWQPPDERGVHQLYESPRTGLGVLCGARSGSLEMLELETEPDWERFRDLAHHAGLGDLLRRIIDGYLEEAPRGGMHLLYRCEEVAGNLKLAERPGHLPSVRVTIAETRGEGGFTILAPSYGRVHPSGKPYRRVCGSFASIVTVTPEERRDLHALARTMDEMPVVPEPSWSSSKSTPGGRPGDIFNEVGTWEEVLEPHGWVQLFTAGDGDTHWRRPGKRQGTSATTKGGVFYVFTSSTAFEPFRGYSRFSAYTILEHGGDFTAAARTLASDPRIAPQLEERRPLSPASSPPPWPEPMGDAAFHGLAGAIVAGVDPHTEADRHAVLCNVLVAFGNAIGPGPHVLVGATRHPGRLNAVQLGQSSRGRKGEGWSPVRELFSRAAPEWLDTRVQGGLSSGEGLIAAVRDRVMKGEEVVDEGVRDKRLLALEPEFGRTLRVCRRDGSTLSAIIRDAYDRGELRVMTKAQLRASGTHISILGHITAEELRRELTDIDVANGFANRFAFLCVRRSKVLPEPEPFEGQVVADLVVRLHRAVEHGTTLGRVGRDDHASRLWRDVYGDLTADIDGLVGSLAARAEAHVTRLSLTYAALDGAPAIGVEHLAAALEFWAYCERSLEHIFGTASGDPLADTILRALAAGKLTRNAIRDLFGRHESSARITAALEHLLRDGLVAREMRTTAGRPAEVWRRTT